MSDAMFKKIETKFQKIDENTTVMENEFFSMTVVELRSSKGDSTGYNIFASTRTRDPEKQNEGYCALLLGLVNFFGGMAAGIGVPSQVILDTINACVKLGENVEKSPG